jgi:hypothetical protein
MIQLDPIPAVSGNPADLFNRQICRTCEYAVTLAARHTAIAEQIARHSCTRYVATGQQAIVSPSTYEPGRIQVTFFIVTRAGELIPCHHETVSTPIEAAKKIPQGFTALDAIA